MFQAYLCLSGRLYQYLFWSFNDECTAKKTITFTDLNMNAAKNKWITQKLCSDSQVTMAASKVFCVFKQRTFEMFHNPFIYMTNRTIFRSYK